jgi:hypothetical protein
MSWGLNDYPEAADLRPGLRRARSYFHESTKAKSRPENATRSPSLHSLSRHDWLAIPFGAKRLARRVKRHPIREESFPKAGSPPGWFGRPPCAGFREGSSLLTLQAMLHQEILDNRRVV